MVTKDGIIKRTDATDFDNIRSTGIRAITLREGDELVFCALSNGKLYHFDCNRKWPRYSL